MWPVNKDGFSVVSFFIDLIKLPFQPGRRGARVSVSHRGKNIPRRRKVTMGIDYRHDESSFPIEWRIINPATVRYDLTLAADP